MYARITRDPGCRSTTAKHRTTVSDQRYAGRRTFCGGRYVLAFCTDCRCVGRRSRHGPAWGGSRKAKGLGRWTGMGKCWVGSARPHETQQACICLAIHTAPSLRLDAARTCEAVSCRSALWTGLRLRTAARLRGVVSHTPTRHWNGQRPSFSAAIERPGPLNPLCSAGEHGRFPRAIYCG